MLQCLQVCSVKLVSLSVLCRELHPWCSAVNGSNWDHVPVDAKTVYLTSLFHFAFISQSVYGVHNMMTYFSVVILFRRLGVSADAEQVLCEPLVI